MYSDDFVRSTKLIFEMLAEVQFLEIYLRFKESFSGIDSLWFQNNLSTLSAIGTFLFIFAGFLVLMNVKMRCFMKKQHKVSQLVKS